jgi:hypothetical protein
MTAAPEDDTPANSDEQVEAFIAWLHQSPPYELVGRIVCEASALELGLFQCAAQVGTPAEKLKKQRLSGVLSILKKSPHPNPLIDNDLLASVKELSEKRDAVVHGAPMNLFGKPDLHGFTKQNRDTGEGYYWYGFEADELEALASQLRELAEIVQSVVLTYEPSGS